MIAPKPLATAECPEYCGQRYGHSNSDLHFGGLAFIMPGETNLSDLLQTMSPVLQPERFVFCTLPSLPTPLGSLPWVGLFQEAEGVTLIVPQATAIAQGWSWTYECRQITLTVHSSLAAVGFLATITRALAAAGISVNPVSAFYHDHLFVPVDQADAAIGCLHALRT